MCTLTISLPEQLKSFVDEQVSRRGYATGSEYVRELIRKEQDRLQLRRLQLRGLLLTGAASKPTAPVGAAYFEGLRGRVRKTGRSAPRANAKR